MLLPLTRSVMIGAMMHVETPGNLPIWRAALAQHPDPCLAEYIVNVLVHSFRIGFQHGRAPLQQAGYNSQCPDPTIVSDYLMNQIIKLTDLEARHLNTVALSF